ncbi:MAG: hypothetical protein IIB13_03405 [Chloroflexi bacterium]|nr:hypothetical protein [Chloroflexota bacterium]
MFKRFGRQSATKDPKKKQLWGKDFDIVSDGLDERQVVSFVTDLLKQREESVPASIRSILKTAVVSAERITDAIQKKAQAEAEDEAARIIAQANRKVEETAGKPEKENKKPLEAVLPEAAEAPGEETEDTAQLPVEASGETTGLPVQVQSEATEEQVEETPRLPSDTGDTSSAEIIESIPAEPQLTEGKRAPEEPSTVLSKQDTQSLYTGEVELSVTKPVDPKMVARLYNYLQTTPEIKFVRTSGSWERGTTITVALDKPIALISVLSSKIPEAEVVPERPERDGFVSGKKGVRSIKLSLKTGKAA